MKLPYLVKLPSPNKDFSVNLACVISGHRRDLTGISGLPRTADKQWTRHIRRRGQHRITPTRR